MISTTIKSLSADGTRIGGYLVVFGSPSQKDLTGEYFTPQTDLGVNWYPRRPALFEHGLNGDSTPIGVIDSLVEDEIGLWAEAALDPTHPNIQAVHDLTAAGKLAWSSGSLPNLVRKAADGRIIRWPIVEGSLTTRPAERRYTTVNALKSAYHALGLDTARLEIAQVSGGENHMPEEVTVNDTLAQSVGELHEAIKTLREQMAGFTPVSPRLAPVKRLPMAEATPTTPRIEITRATKYSELSPADMSFLYEILAGGRGWTPGDAFYRELADKVLTAVSRRELPYDAARGLVERGIKSANDIDTSGQAGFGTEWVADSWRSELWLRVRQDNVVAPLFQFIEMPTSPFELPIESIDPTVYFVAETNDSATFNPSASPITLSKIASSKIQMAAKKLALRIGWSSELNEDSIIPIIANYRRQAVRALQNAIDNVLINGDTATGASVNVNLIDGTPTAGTKYLAFDGLRKYALVTNPTQKYDGAGAPTLKLFRVLRFLLKGAYAVRPQDCAIIVDNNTYAALLALPEFLTVDKAGNAATNLTGQIGAIDSVPVFASAEMGLSQSSDGKLSGTPANNTKGQALIVFRPNWLIGYRRQVDVRMDFLPWSDAYQLVVSARLCLVNFDTQSAAALYDLTV